MLEVDAFVKEKALSTVTDQPAQVAAQEQPTRPTISLPMAKSWKWPLLYETAITAASKVQTFTKGRTWDEVGENNVYHRLSRRALQRQDRSVAPCGLQVSVETIRGCNECGGLCFPSCPTSLDYLRVCSPGEVSKATRCAKAEAEPRGGVLCGGVDAGFPIIPVVLSFGDGNAGLDLGRQRSSSSFQSDGERRK
ncbi:hypothetical protein CDD81_1445 [Ophiocordyceps australis]|uniref:Uncharacterized protein n=1 Tax=Ophiocordyceps australis TaxID=1399860 RepID=A0A2C5X826_9HYPO|nr:hypothetical protein CDD81_1445 [Ophiocordyceps australis]